MLSGVRLFATPWTVACQAPLSMGFSRQEYWSTLPFPSPGDLPDPRIEPTSPAFPTLAGGFLTTSQRHLGSLTIVMVSNKTGHTQFPIPFRESTSAKKRAPDTGDPKAPIPRTKRNPQGLPALILLTFQEVPSLEGGRNFLLSLEGGRALSSSSAASFNPLLSEVLLHLSGSLPKYRKVSNMGQGPFPTPGNRTKCSFTLNYAIYTNILSKDSLWALPLMKIFSELAPPSSFPGLCAKLEP